MHWTCTVCKVTSFVPPLLSSPRFSAFPIYSIPIPFRIIAHLVAVAPTMRSTLWQVGLASPADAPNQGAGSLCASWSAKATATARGFKSAAPAAAGSRAKILFRDMAGAGGWRHEGAQAASSSKALDQCTVTCTAEWTGFFTNFPVAGLMSVGRGSLQ